MPGWSPPAGQGRRPSPSTTGSSMPCSHEQRRSTEPLCEDEDVGEVTRLGPVEQRDQLSPGEFLRVECWTGDRHHGWMTGRHIDGDVDDHQVRATDREPSEGRAELKRHRRTTRRHWRRIGTAREPTPDRPGLAHRRSRDRRTSREARRRQRSSSRHARSTAHRGSLRSSDGVARGDAVGLPCRHRARGSSGHHRSRSCCAALPRHGSHGLFTQVLHPALMDDHPGVHAPNAPSRHRGIESAALGSSGDGARHGGDGVGSRRAHHQAWSGPHFRGREISVLIERVFDLTW
jgi:hypothetical protein